MTLRKWKFAVETADEHGYLDASGLLIRDPEDAKDFLGTNAEASMEAARRANDYELLTGYACEKVVYASQGKVAGPPKTLCIVCFTHAATVPDRDSGSSRNRLCAACHAKRLQGDIRQIVTTEQNRRQNNERSR